MESKIKEAVKMVLSVYAYESLIGGVTLGKQIPAIDVYRISCETGFSIEEIGAFKW